MTGEFQYQKGAKTETNDESMVEARPKYKGCLCWRKKVKNLNFKSGLSFYDPEKEKKSYIIAMRGWKKVKTVVNLLKLGK